ncbi:hypothetical protein [Yanshouia hominis]|uniref:Threonine aldolase, low-specificity n=1 Tax=Yanshouia hominis TaxID=2763673 RepID=A0ABR7NPX1_9FIRM|nr:hypothetical protein [Yanshouia hominis]MBC8577708.1 threonine aldolase, low-specificity [Yanshouia hominis]
MASLGVWLRQPQTAAPARYALRHQVNRLKEEHRHARFVAEGITGLNHVRSQERVQTNLLMLKMVDRGAEKYCRLLEEQGIIAGLIGDDRVRLVFTKKSGRAGGGDGAADSRA